MDDDFTPQTLSATEVIQENTLCVTNKVETQEISSSSINETEIEEEISSLDPQKDVPQPPIEQEHKTMDPILEKVGSLYNKIKSLKKEHLILSDEVKTITSEQFCGSDVVAAAIANLRTEHEQLKNKYVEEALERRRLYNQVIELKGNIRVFCRCRPLNQNEIASGVSSVVEIDSSRETELHILSSDSSKKQFKFDHVFGPDDNQEDVFAQTSAVVISVLDGFNVCIFAYGQTGTGKTFTMEGVQGNRGVNYRTLEELFRISSERSSTMKYELFVSMLEVYNEKIRDLLIDNSTQPTKKLEIKQAAEGTLEIPGLVEARVYNTDEVWELLKTGSQNRAVGSTNANELSSRSHCLFRVTVRGENLVNGQRTRSHLWLVDLAGSERVGRIDVDGERLKESQFINKSLSALGDVISALASKTSHIPYRNSKLTHLLQSSLGGDCKALMFVQISPSSADLGETLCSLNFASRVRGIEHGPARKQADPAEHFKFKQMAEKLRHEEKETRKLQESMQVLQLRFAARDQLCKTLQEKTRDLENKLAEERKIRLQQETRTATIASAAKSMQQEQRVQNVKKPPLGPLKRREPLRRITNFLPPPTPISPHKIGVAQPTAEVSQVEKENDSDTSTRPDSMGLMKPRRVSIAVHRPMDTMQGNQLRPKKQRVSIATLRPDSELLSASKTQNGGTMARRLFTNDTRRRSRIFSPLPELTSPVGAETIAPTVGRSKFLGSPPGKQQVGPWRPKHPTTIALQRRLANSEASVDATPTAGRGKLLGRSPVQHQVWKPKQQVAVLLQRRNFVWSPLKEKIQRKERRSLPPSRLAHNF